MQAKCQQRPKQVKRLSRITTKREGTKRGDPELRAGHGGGDNARHIGEGTKRGDSELRAFTLRGDTCRMALITGRPHREGYARRARHG